MAQKLHVRSVALPRPFLGLRCDRLANKPQHGAPAWRCRAVVNRNMLSVIPEQYAKELEEQATHDMLRQIQSQELTLSGGTVHATYVGPQSPPSAEGKPKLVQLCEADVRVTNALGAYGTWSTFAGRARLDSFLRAGRSPVVLIHGFDCSCLDFRRIKPFLDPHVQTWAVDLLGCGFCVIDLKNRPEAQVGPEERREHLYAFWKRKINRPMTLTGTSLGAAVAIDFALAHPEAVDRLILIAPQVLKDGIGPLESLPTFAAQLGVKLMQTMWLRKTASKMAYYDKEKFATIDTVRAGRLHTFVPGWQDAVVAFMKSGGYRVSKLLPQIPQDTTMIWGANDEILGPEGGQALAKKMPKARLITLEKCGHNLHLEKPEEAAAIILDLLRVSEGKQIDQKKLTTSR